MGKTYIITGSTSGIGKKTAEYLASKGNRLVLLGRDNDKLDTIKGAISESCLGTYSIDLTIPENIEEIFKDLRTKGIKLDGLIHCAGLDTSAMPVRLVKIENIDKLMKLHVEAFIELSKWFYKKDISNVGASIIGISSLASISCLQNSIDYSASKAALNAAVKVMAKEFLKRDIRVNAILPANVDTPMCDNLKKLGDITSIQPMGFISPEYITYLIEFLLSEKARFITGALIPVSAGMDY